MTDIPAEQPPDFSSLAARAGGRVSLVVSDVDGTLVNHDKQLTPAAIRAVAALREAGIAFTAVSSRPPRGMSMLVEPLGLEYPMGAFNGGTIFMPDQTVVEEQTIPLAAAEKAVGIMRDFGADIWVFADNKWIVTNPDAPYVAREKRTVQFQPTVVASFEPYLGRAGKIVGSSSDFDRLKDCEAGVREALGGAATAQRSQRYYLDITPPGLNKGTAVRSLARLMNVPLHEVAVLGDMPNDLPMFALAGLTVAMGNAADEVKAAADAVTDTCDDDGFAKAIESVILPRAAGRSDHPR